jgi:hypothetical protein
MQPREQIATGRAAYKVKQIERGESAVAHEWRLAPLIDHRGFSTLRCDQIPDHLEEVDLDRRVEKRGRWWSHRRRLWGLKKNVACTSTYYS